MRILSSVQAGPHPAGRSSQSAWSRLRLPKLSLDEQAALGMWAAAHLALLVLAWAASWVFGNGRQARPFQGSFQQWDASLLQNIAAHGYYSGDSAPHNVIFFPGYPLVLAAAHLALRDWVLSELAVSAVAGCFAVVSLARLAGSRQAVTYLLTMPAAVFLMTGYSECLFLALAIPAWRAGTRGRWKTAALLAALSGLVRPDALFLIPALAVMALAGPAGRRAGNAAVACCAMAGPLLYEAYLTVTSGWDAWLEANRAGWGLYLVSPSAALRATWRMAAGHGLAAGVALEIQAEIAAVAVMAGAAALFLLRRRWPGAVYCGLAAIAIGTQTWYETGDRTLLLLFPVCAALAAAERRHPWVRLAWLGASVPLAAVIGLLYLSGQWAG